MKISKLIKLTGMSHAKLAEKTGQTRQTISNYSRREHCPELFKRLLIDIIKENYDEVLKNEQK